MGAVVPVAKIVFGTVELIIVGLFALHMAKTNSEKKLDNKLKKLEAKAN